MTPAAAGKLRDAIVKAHADHVGRRGGGCRACWRRLSDAHGCAYGIKLRRLYQAARDLADHVTPIGVTPP